LPETKTDPKSGVENKTFQRAYLKAEQTQNRQTMEVVDLGRCNVTPRPVVLFKRDAALRP